MNIECQKRVEIKDDVSEILSLIDVHGSENVTVLNFWGFMDNTNESEYSLYLELIQKLNHKSLEVLINSIYDHSSFFSSFEEYLIDKGCLEYYKDLNELLIGTALKHNLSLNCVKRYTSIDLLNKLAEKDLINLFCIERIDSIDLAFVTKYWRYMDLGNLKKCSTTDDVLEFINSL